MSCNNGWIINVIVMVLISFSEAREIVSLYELTKKYVCQNSLQLFGNDPVEVANNEQFQKFVFVFPDSKKLLTQMININEVAKITKKITLSVTQENSGSTFTITNTEKKHTHSWFEHVRCWTDNPRWSHCFKKSVLGENRFFALQGKTDGKRNIVIKHYEFNETYSLLQKRECRLPDFWHVDYYFIETSNPEKYLVCRNGGDIWEFNFETFTLGNRYYQAFDQFKINKLRNQIALAKTIQNASQIDIYSIENLETPLLTINSALMNIEAMKFCIDDAYLMLGKCGPDACWSIVSLYENKELFVKNHPSAVCDFKYANKTDREVIMIDGCGAYYSLKFPYILAYNLVMQAAKEQQVNENADQALSNQND